MVVVRGGGNECDLVVGFDGDRYSYSSETVVALRRATHVEPIGLTNCPAFRILSQVTMCDFSGWNFCDTYQEVISS